MPRSRRFLIRTYGCQMNVHDSEKVSNLLLHHGYEAADTLDDADLLIINTCSIRDKAEHKLYSDLGRLREWKRARAGRALGVAGCVAQQEGDRILRRFDQVDFVFGTHNLRWVPAMAEAAARGSRSIRIQESGSLERFDLPERHPDYEGTTAGRAFVTVMEGCDMFCSFCVVPHTRGREISRPAESILAEVRDVVERGVSEVTLLGQTVNAYGRHDVRQGREVEQGTMPFAALLRALDGISGLRRVRYTSRRLRSGAQLSAGTTPTWPRASTTSLSYSTTRATSRRRVRSTRRRRRRGAVLLAPSIPCWRRASMTSRPCSWQKAICRRAWPPRPSPSGSGGVISA